MPQARARHPVATLAAVGAPWLIPVIGVGFFVHRHFICEQDNPADARAKAVARGRPPKTRRRTSSKAAHHVKTCQQQPQIYVDDQERQLADAVLGNDMLYELFNEDEVDALQQAHNNPQALLSILQQYGSRMDIERISLDGDDYSEDSLWFTDEMEHSWQHDNPSPDPQKQLQPCALDELIDDMAGPAAARQRPSLPIDLQHGEDQRQQGQQQGTVTPQCSAESNAGAYFDDNYFGLSADQPAAAWDLQELQATLNRNLEALLPKDTTWGASYPPRVDEVLSPAGMQPASAHQPHPDLDLGLEPDLDLDYDTDFDPGFDYVPDFDFDTEFGPGFDDAAMDMFEFDLEP